MSDLPLGSWIGSRIRLGRYFDIDHPRKKQSGKEYEMEYFWGQISYWVDEAMERGLDRFEESRKADPESH